MGQAEVADFLEGEFKTNPDKYFTASEMAEALGTTSKNVRVSLRCLRRYGEVEFRNHGPPSNGGPDTLEYRYKK